MLKTVNNLDLIARVEKLVESPAGKVWRDKYVKLDPPLVPDQRLLFDRAAELAAEYLALQGVTPDRGEIEADLREISCQFDADLYRKVSVGTQIILSHLFSHQVPEIPFTSPDGREIAYVEQLRQYQRQGMGVVYLSNHSSHLDEFIIGSLLVTLRLGLPLFAAGTNMMVIKSLAKMLMLASYTVQRRAAGKVYLASLFNYCRAISETAQQQGIFLEAWHGGARSRDGSLRYPRRLITLRGALAAEGRDLVIQPVALSYSIVPEDLYLAANGGGRGWLRGMGFWRTGGYLVMNPRRGFWRAARNLYGRAYCTLTRPRLLSELKTLYTSDLSGLSLDEFVALNAMKEIAAAKKIMASQLVARGLSRARKRDNLKIAAAIQEEKEQIFEYHQSAFGMNPDLEDFIINNEPARVLQDGYRTLRRRKIIKRRRDKRGLPLVSNEGGLSFYATHGDRRLYSPTAKENIVVAGAGDSGYAWAYLIGNRTLEEKRYLNASFTLYESRSEAAAEMGVERSASGLYHEYRLPKNVFVTDDAPSAFKKANLVIMSPPLEKLKEHMSACLSNAELPLKIVLLSSGFDPGSNKLSYRIAMEETEAFSIPVNLFALAGPVNEFDLLRDQPGRMILAGSSTGLREVGHLFRWPPLQVVAASDPLGLHLATVLAEVYGLWGSYLRLSKAIDRPELLGTYAAQASGEAMLWARHFGAQDSTFNSTSPIWLSSFSASALNPRIVEMLRETLKKQRRQAGAALLGKAKSGEDESALQSKLRQNFISLKYHAGTGNLDVPLFYQAYERLVDGLVPRLEAAS
jgi:hypothetical protein